MGFLGDGLRVHHVTNRYPECFVAAGAKYVLYSAYDFIKSGPNTTLAKATLAMLPFVKHSIMDSGLFTLLFGADTGKQFTVKDAEQWQDKLCEFALTNNLPSSIVECDVQGLFGQEVAWRMRQQMRDRLKGFNVINVAHVCDGKAGVDRLIEFSDYIAFSVPDFRKCFGLRTGEAKATSLSYYAKNKKPDIKIHMLGQTNVAELQRLSFVDTVDSSTSQSPARCGTIDSKHVDTISDDKLKEASILLNQACQKMGLPPNNSRSKIRMVIYAQYYMNHIERHIGKQD